MYYALIVIYIYLYYFLLLYWLYYVSVSKEDLLHQTNLGKRKQNNKKQNNKKVPRRLDESFPLPIFKSTVILSFQATELPGIKIFRMEASLYFANAEYFVKKLYSKTSVDPRKLVIYREKKVKAAEKLRKQQEKEMKDPSGVRMRINMLRNDNL